MTDAHPVNPAPPGSVHLDLVHLDLVHPDSPHPGPGHPGPRTREHTARGAAI